MTTPHSKQENREIWFNRIEQWQRSGLTQADYCRQQNLKPSSFYNWLAKHRQSQGTTALTSHRNGTGPKLIPVSIESIATELTLTVGELSLTFSSQLLPAALIPWIRALTTAEY